MQNRTFLVYLRPIFCEKLKIAPPHRKTAPPQTFEFPISAEKSVSIWVKTFFFFFLCRPPDFGRKKPLSFRPFGEISSQISDKPCETDSRTMKIRVKVVCTVLTVSKKPPPFSKSWLRACLYVLYRSFIIIFYQNSSILKLFDTLFSVIAILFHFFNSKRFLANERN